MHAHLHQNVIHSPLKKTQWQMNSLPQNRFTSLVNRQISHRIAMSNEKNTIRTKNTFFFLFSLAVWKELERFSFFFFRCRFEILIMQFSGNSVNGKRTKCEQTKENKYKKIYVKLDTSKKKSCKFDVFFSSLSFWISAFGDWIQFEILPSPE